MRPYYGKKRGAGDDAATSFDSLLDTMTNVVGILVVLLVVTQLGVRDAMRQIQNALPPVSEAQLDQARKEAASVKSEYDALSRRQSMAKERSSQEKAEAARLRQSISAVQSRLAARPLPPGTAKLDEEMRLLKERVAQAERDTSQRQKALDDAKRQLAAIPVREPLPARVVRLPSPRPAPPGAPCFWFVCSGNRVAYLDMNGLNQGAKDRVQMMARRLVVAGQRVPIRSRLSGSTQHRGRDDSLIYDGGKLIQYFKETDVGSRDFRLNVTVANTGQERLHAVLRPNRGEVEAMLPHVTSKYRQILKEVARANGYVRFGVCTDSFEAYTVAREVLERYYNLPAGWMLLGSPDIVISWDMGVKLQGEQPPQPPTTAGSAPAPPPMILD